MNLEQSTIGLCLADKDNLEIAVEKHLTPECFTNEKNAKIFSAMLEARSKKIVADATYLFSKLGNDYGPIIAELIANAPIQQNVEFYIKELTDTYWLKNSSEKIRQLYMRLKARQQFSEVSLLKADIEKTVKDIITSDICDELISKKSFEVADALIDELDQKIANARNNIKNYITTGIPKLDMALSGFHNGALYILAARTSMGKTTLACNFATTAYKAGYKPAYFTVEMSNTQILSKIVSDVGRVRYSNIFNANLSEEERDRVIYALRDFGSSTFSMNFKVGHSLEKIESECRRLKRKGEIDILFIDYIQQIKTQQKFHSKQAELTEVSSRLKSLALDLQIPIIALAQLNRDAEKKGEADIDPNLSHLKDSGSIEQDADAVIMIHRPDRYDSKGSVKLLIEKNRFGKCGNITINFDMEYNRFYE